MAIEVTITLAELDRARALLLAAHAKGYTASVAVFAVERAGRSIYDCVAVSDGLLLTAGSGSTDYGRQRSAEHARPLPPTCEHLYGDGQNVEPQHCGRPVKQRVMWPGRRSFVVCGVHARFWAARGRVVKGLDE